MNEETNDDLIERSRVLRKLMEKRRSVRSFSDKKIPQEVIENCIAVAGSAPSGANMQPWTFVLVNSPEVKHKIRIEAERVEREFYEVKITKEWREKLEPLKVSYNKPFLEEAPYLICIFVQKYGIDKNGEKIKHYYPLESAGIATGFLISALHQLGISSLTYTPAPVSFLSDVLGRPENERPLMILAVGYPKENFEFPDIKKKTLDDILTIT